MCLSFSFSVCYKDDASIIGKAFLLSILRLIAIIWLVITSNLLIFFPFTYICRCLFLLYLLSASKHTGTYLHSTYNRKQKASKMSFENKSNFSHHWSTNTSFQSLKKTYWQKHVLIVKYFSSVLRFLRHWSVLNETIFVKLAFEIMSGDKTKKWQTKCIINS